MAADGASNKVEETVEPISLQRLILGFPLYFKTARALVRHPIGFAGQLRVQTQDDFWKAFEFMSYGIVLSFLLMIPSFIAHGEKLSKLTFFARLVLQFVMYGSLLHLGFRMMGSKSARLKGTLAAYGYVLGVSFPLYIVLYFPLILRFGPKTLFGTAQDVQDMSALLVNNIGLDAYLLCAQLAYGTCALVFLLKWFSKCHGITKLRVFGTLFLAAIPMAVIQILVLNPLFNFVFGWVDRFLDYL